MAGDRFEITTSATADGQVVALIGELDVDSAPALRGWLDGFEPSGPLVELDLAALTFLDSTGVGCLYRLHHKVADAGGLLVAPRPPASIRRVLEISGLHRMMALTD
jgi:anti-sigma B factor antagonist